MAFGCITSAPHAPRPPAFATAMESDGGQAPAIGARRIGTRSPNRSQKARARRRVGCVLVMLITDRREVAEHHHSPDFGSEHALGASPPFPKLLPAAQLLRMLRPEKSRTDRKERKGGLAGISQCVTPTLPSMASRAGALASLRAGCAH